MHVFETFLEKGDEAIGQKVRELEHRADDLKDREDLYDAIAGIDYLVNFTKTTVYELHLYKTAPDKFMRSLSEELTAGVVSLRKGFALLDKDPVAAEPFAVAAHKAERKMKKIYRRGMVVLLDKENFKQQYAGDPAQPSPAHLAYLYYQLAEIFTGEQPQEGLRGIFQAVYHVFPVLYLPRGQPL